VILPGVGAAADAMTRLRNSGLDALIPTLTQPVLGICLGMQLLHEASRKAPPAVSGSFPAPPRVSWKRPDAPFPHGLEHSDGGAQLPLLSGVGGTDYAYFVHSYALPVSEATVASCRYGASFSACVAWRNFYGAQFHPERSAGVGARLLRNFLQIGAAPALRDVPCA